MSLIKYLVVIFSSVTVLTLLNSYMILQYMYIPQVQYSPSSSSTEHIAWQNGNCYGLNKWAIVTSESNKTTSGMMKILNLTQDWCLLIIGKYSQAVDCSLRTQHNTPDIYVNCRSPSPSL